MIKTHNLTKRFGAVEAIEDITLAVPEASVFALIGPNGAGKTTTIKTLMNILRPTSGRAEILGVDSRKLGPEQFAQVGQGSQWVVPEEAVRDSEISLIAAVESGKAVVRFELNDLDLRQFGFEPERR
jgi:ABC-type multidrug transport system ATPase subunit